MTAGGGGPCASLHVGAESLARKAALRALDSGRESEGMNGNGWVLTGGAGGRAVWRESLAGTLPRARTHSDVPPGAMTDVDMAGKKMLGTRRCLSCVCVVCDRARRVVGAAGSHARMQEKGRQSAQDVLLIHAVPTSIATVLGPRVL